MVVTDVTLISSVQSHKICVIILNGRGVEMGTVSLSF